MLGHRKTFGFLAIAAVYFLGICANSSYALDPPPTNNADGCKDTLAEREIIQMSRPFKYEDLSVYQGEVEPVLQRMDRVLPRFGQALRNVMAKNWRFGFDQIDECPSENAWFSEKSEKVACESHEAGVINPAWFFELDTPCKKPQNGAEERDLVQKQKDTLLRELLLGLRIGSGVKSTQLAAVLAVMTQTDPLATAEDLERVLEENGFDSYASEPLSVCTQTASNQDLITPIENQVSAVQKVVAATPRPLSKKELETYKAAAALLLKNSKFGCQITYAKGGLVPGFGVSLFDHAQTGELVTGAQSSIVFHTIWGQGHNANDQTTVRINTSPDQQSVLSVELTDYELGEVNSGSLINPKVGQGWRLALAQTCKPVKVSSAQSGAEVLSAAGLGNALTSPNFQQCFKIYSGSESASAAARDCQDPGRAQFDFSSPNFQTCFGIFSLEHADANAANQCMSEVNAGLDFNSSKFQSCYADKKHSYASAEAALQCVSSSQPKSGFVIIQSH